MRWRGGWETDIATAFLCPSQALEVDDEDYVTPGMVNCLHSTEAEWGTENMLRKKYRPLSLSALDLL